MIDEIPKYPFIPETLRQAAYQKRLVPFIGAGVSRVAGYPDWDGLAQGAMKYFIGQPEFNHAQLDQISRLTPRVKLSLSADLEKEHNLIVDFSKILVPSPEKIDIREDVYERVNQLWRFSEIFVTTNYDKELDNPSPLALGSDEGSTHNQSRITPRIIHLHSDMTVDILDSNNTVVHIHGSVKKRESMVLTTLDYVLRYQSHRLEEGNYVENKYLTFLAQLFKTRNVLFIGYGLEELEILEYIIQKSLERRSLQTRVSEQPKHFLLQGFFSHELSLARSLDGYFRSFGIQLLPFSRDERDWESLIDALEELNRKLPPGSRLSSSERLDMDALLS